MGETDQACNSLREALEELKEIGDKEFVVPMVDAVSWNTQSGRKESALLRSVSSKRKDELDNGTFA